MKIMTRVILPLLSLLLYCCAPHPGVVPLYIQGKKMALLESKGYYFNATVYDLKGRTIYNSDFVGGCKGLPQSGSEVIGTRFRYDSAGNFASHWEIAPDTSRAVYFERTPWGVEGDSARYVYTDKKLDSIYIYSHGPGRGHDQTVIIYSGHVCINFGPGYISHLNGVIFALNQGSPFLYDSMVFDNTDSKGRLLGHIVHTQDSIVEIGFHKDGKIGRTLHCRVGRNESCVKNEWFESGKPSVEEKPVGGHMMHRHYYENGNPMTESFYKGTKLDSIYRSWHENGKLGERVEYKMGVEVKNEKWDEKGAPVVK
jgi:hypothetical protein